MKVITFRITDDCDLLAEKHYEQCLSLQSQPSQGGYTMQAAEVDREIYKHHTLAKSYNTKSYLDMMGLSLGTKDILDTPTAVSPAPNAWKPTNQPTH